MKLICFVLSLLVTLCLADGLNETCSTTMLQLGRCVLVKDCPFVLNMMRSTTKSDEEWYYLDNNKCGGTFDSKPLICCPLVTNEKGCGVVRVNNRIFGGEETGLGEIPWAGVILYQISRRRFAVKCGCTLVNSRWVITAAHCIVSVPSSWNIHRVRFSESNVLIKKDDCATNENGKNVTSDQCRQEYEIESVKTHPYFDTNEPNMRHDIAMLKTKIAVTITDYVVPVCLPFSHTVRMLPVENETFTVTGWGQTDGENPGVQHHVQITGRNNKVCDKAFKPREIVLTEDQLCVGGEKGKDSCRGDSGGALTRDVGLVTYLAGIVSFGAQNCGTQNHPGVYTNIVNYLDWIEETMSTDDE